VIESAIKLLALLFAAIIMQIAITAYPSVSILLVGAVVFGYGVWQWHLSVMSALIRSEKNGGKKA
jgi:hypothetical protein